MGKGTMLRINGLREQLRWERIEKMLLAAAGVNGSEFTLLVDVCC